MFYFNIFCFNTFCFSLRYSPVRCQYTSCTNDEHWKIDVIGQLMRIYPIITSNISLVPYGTWRQIFLLSEHTYVRTYVHHFRCFKMFCWTNLAFKSQGRSSNVSNIYISDFGACCYTISMCMCLLYCFEITFLGLMQFF